MKRLRNLATILLLTACATTTPTSVEDPYLWLEAIDDARALAWVAEQNERTRRELASGPGFAEMQAQALAALSSQSRVPTVAYHGRYLYNLWKDAQHPRGIYRRTTLDELRKPSPQWTTVLDIDEMSRRDGKQWVFKNMECLPPEERQCLVSISPGGGDAVEIREFDSETLRFVDNGFFVPLNKSNVEWIDENTLYIGTDAGPGSLTESGYARLVRVWKRGTPLSAATTIYEGSPKSVSSYARRIRTAGKVIDIVEESLTAWETKFFVRDGETLRPLALPPTAEIEGGFRGKLVVKLLEPWGDFVAGSIVSVDAASNGGAPQLLVAPTVSSVVADVDISDESILVETLDNVRGRLSRITADGQRQPIAFPDNGALTVMTVNDDTGDALVKFETFVDPPALYFVSGTTATKIFSQQPTFDGSRFDVTQNWTTSKDGTRIPYFMVAPKGMKRDGSNPTHIFSYGGFRSTLTPSYSGSYEQHYGAYGKLWLERGGVFVLANIRGGAEFGPQWHSSALKENRVKAYEDFEAIAADLARTGVTSPGHLGIEGRSNGGLLTLATMVRRPDLYGAVISGAPLADMLRYHELLAGASWMGEYGDPRIPAERAFIAQYSPYQKFTKNADYPPLFVYASTRDDRVHPGHARKTVARLQDLGHDVFYFENVEGGHGGSSTNEQLAYRIALSYAHLWRHLK